MKKTTNVFRNTQASNTMRVVVIFCAVAIVGSAVLLLTIPSVRESIKNRLHITSETVRRKQVPQDKDIEVGLADTAVVNNNGHVPPLTLQDHVMGNISAPVQLIVYIDFECPFCLQYYSTLQRVKEEFGNDLVIGIRHFPLTNHSEALPAAVAAECAGKQDKFFDMYHALFALQQANTFTTEEINKTGLALGLDQDAYRACLTSHEPEAKIGAQKDEARALGVGGTPASFINGDYYAGALPYDDFTYPDGTEAQGLRSLIKARLGN